MTHDNSSDCKQCEMCCKAIPLSRNSDELKELGGPDAKFVLKYWKPITQQLAFNINPHLKDVEKKFQSGKLKGWEVPQNYYTCTLLDKNNRCSKHYERPQVCSNYPWYNHATVTEDELIGGRDCGFYKHTEEAKRNDKSNVERL